MFNIEEQCCSNNFNDTEIILENYMVDLVMKDKEKMTGDYKESAPMRFCQLICENYVQFFTALENTRIFQTLIIYKRKLLLWHVGMVLKPGGKRQAYL